MKPTNRIASVSEADLAPVSPTDRVLGRPVAFALPAVAECVDAAHPSLPGRVLVRWTDAAEPPRERWVCSLQSVVVREGDRVLLQQPSNWDEPVVVGVLDGLHGRVDPPRATVATLPIARDERIQVTTSRGEPLVEIHHTDEGPVVRLLHEDVNLDLPGSFRVRARAIELDARQGEIVVCASDDLILQGEFVRMN